MKLLKVTPFLTLILAIMGGSSLRIGGCPVLPAFFLIPVYYWLVYRSDLLPLWSLFAVGLFYDALLSHELGLTSLFLMLSSFFGHYIRPYLTPYHFLFIWGAFGIYSFIYLTFFSLCASGSWPFFTSWLYGILLYPSLAYGLSHLHTRLHSYD